MVDQHYPERSEVSMAPGAKQALCRCWQSKKFPYCDGSHRAWNEKTGKQQGPVVVTVDQADAAAT